MKRKWTNIAVIESEIRELRAAGKTRQEIADELGLTKVQIKNWINRSNKNMARIESGLPPKKRGLRVSGAGDSEKDYTIKRLKMENELLRDFLRAVGRR